MADHVTFKITICFKFLIALRTLEWRFICMGSNVIGQGFMINIFFLAKIALKWNFLCMSTHMNDKVVELSMSFGTKITSPNPMIDLIRC
jgi:hypothetical protein